MARVFAEEGAPFVVVDLSQEALAEAASDGYPYLQGNATSDEVLKEAGIYQARRLVAALGSDADNIYVTLSARGLRSDLFIVARACADDSESKLKRAGADRIISPHRLGGRHMAMFALRPLVVDFLDIATHSRDRELVLEDIKVGSGSPLAGVTIKEGQQYSGGTAILVVKKRDGSLLTHPSPETLLELGDELVVIGTREQLRAMEGSV